MTGEGGRFVGQTWMVTYVGPSLPRNEWIYLVVGEGAEGTLRLLDLGTGEADSVKERCLIEGKEGAFLLWERLA